MLNLVNHPCFNAEVKGHCARVHLPVAPRCNILCNYCNRKHDCVNESRPGVTSAVLTPGQALAYLEKVLDHEPRITVVGIAGPGDPFANPKETLETLRLIRQRFPELLFCVATNGLGLPAYAEELADLGATHVTLTVNAVDPEVGQLIYSWVWEGKRVHRGRKAAEVLLDRQLKAIPALKALGVMVKVNSIIIPGVNDRHIPEVAREMARLGVDILNCMPVYPHEETPFAEVPEPTMEEVAAIRREAGEFLPQMLHCTRCRADAVGLLGEDQSGQLQSCLQSYAAMTFSDPNRPYVAVATREGMLVNLHLGEAPAFQIWAKNDHGFKLIEERPAPPPGSGAQRWWQLAETLKDCQAVLVGAMGETPRAVLTECGIKPLEMSGFIEAGLEAVYQGDPAGVLKGRRGGIAQGCSGKKLGGGCL